MKKSLIKDVVIYLSFSVFLIFTFSLIKYFENLFFSFEYLAIYDLQVFTQIGIYLTYDNNIFNNLFGAFIIVMTFILPIIYVIRRIKKEKRFSKRFIVSFVYLGLLFGQTIFSKIIRINRTVDYSFFQITYGLISILFIVAIVLELMHFIKQKNDGIAKGASAICRGYIIYNLFSVIYSLSFQIKQKLEYSQYFDQVQFKIDFRWIIAIFITVIMVIYFEIIIQFLENKENLSLKEKASHLELIKKMSIISIIGMAVSFLYNFIFILSRNNIFTYDKSLFGTINIIIPLFIYYVTIIYKNKYIEEENNKDIEKENNKDIENPLVNETMTVTQ